MWRCDEGADEQVLDLAGLFALARVGEVLLVRQQRHSDRSRGQLAQAVQLGEGRRMLIPLEVLEVDFLGIGKGTRSSTSRG